MTFDTLSQTPKVLHLRDQLLGEVVQAIAKLPTLRLESTGQAKFTFCLDCELAFLQPLGGEETLCPNCQPAPKCAICSAGLTIDEVDVCIDCNIDDEWVREEL